MNDSRAPETRDCKYCDEPEGEPHRGGCPASLSDPPVGKDSSFEEAKTHGEDLQAQRERSEERQFLPSKRTTPMTVYEMLDYLRGEGIERIYKNSKGYWLYPKNEHGINYNPYLSAGPYHSLEEAIHVGAINA